MQNYQNISQYFEREREREKEREKKMKLNYLTSLNNVI